MAAESKISWTDATFNPWRGCTKVSEGCEHCYAESMSERNPGTLGVWGDDGKRVVGAESYWKQPEKWNREAEKAGKPKLVFCASLADVFEDWQGPMHNTDGKVMTTADDGFTPRNYTMNDCRRRLFALIDRTPWLRWLLVTKRPENILRMWPSREHGITHCHPCRENVWLISTMENQANFDKRWTLLERCRHLAPVLGISAEPLLGPIDMCGAKPDWVITGCESRGNGLGRPMLLEWDVDLQKQCKIKNIAFFRKQVGYYGKLSKDPADWNPSMRVQEFPERGGGGWRH
jgi:protein gp37